MKTLAVLVSCAGLWLWGAPAYPQAIDPDHPDLTTSAGVVGRGVDQIETGLDAGVRTTLVGTGPDWSVLAGPSVRFGR